MIEEMSGNVQVRTRSGPWTSASVGLKMDITYELTTGPDSSVVLTFPGGARFTLKELTQVGIAGMLSRAGRARTRIYLKMGEAAAKVKPKGAVQTDFEIQMPTATASARGTEFTVRYNGATASVTVEEGEVLVTPANATLQAVTLQPGQSIDVTKTRVGQVRSTNAAAR